MKYIKSLFLFLFCLIQSCTSQVPKINGISFVAAGTPVTDVHVNPVVAINTNYAAVMPFGFIKNLDNPNIIHNTDRQWFGETRAGVKQYAESLQAKGIKIMIKPQIWVWNGKFTGLIEMKTEADWKKLETSYSSFILEYATLAEEINIDIVCIGTELELFIKNRPQYWSQLIKDIRKIYKGKLTYAANWDEFNYTPFWKQLDYIGVDAYFPVSDSKTPTIKDCLKGWEKHKMAIKTISETNNKPILFTEFGYRSVDFTGKKPWSFDRSMNVVNFEAQNNATKALFKTFWQEDWFAGGFLWKWFIEHDKAGGENDSQFTPQNKPVEIIIKEFYKAN